MPEQDYVAVEQLHVGGALGYNPGDPVTAAVVADHPEWVDAKMVVRAGTKAAEKAQDGS